MKAKILVPVFLAYLSLFSINANASNPQNAYNQSCMEGQSLSGTFQCRPSSLSQNQAHSYCVSMSPSSGSDEYLDCMGAFLPFSDSSNRAHNCVANTATSIRWGNNDSCYGVVNVGNYSHLDRISVSTQSGSSTGIGSASVVCRDGRFTVDLGSSTCVDSANVCELNSPFRWDVTHIGNTKVSDVYRVNRDSMNKTDYPFGFSNLNINKGDFDGVSTSYYGAALYGSNSIVDISDLNNKLNLDYNHMLSMNCDSFSNQTLENYEQKMMTPLDSSSNVINSLNNTSADYKIVKDGSYYVAYCYDGDVNNSISRDRFEFVNNRLNQAGIMNDSQQSNIENVSCVARPRDCSARNIRISALDNGSLSCNFSTPYQQTGSGFGDNKDFLAKSRLNNIGTSGNPVIFDSRTTHGYASVSCLNGHTIVENTKCYETSLCRENNADGVEYGEEYVTHEGIIRYNEEFGHDSIGGAIEGVSQTILENKCRNKSTFGRAAGELRDGYYSHIYDYNSDEGHYSYTASHLCRYIVEPSNANNLCTLGLAQNVEVDGGFSTGHNYVWNCKNGLLERSCAGNNRTTIEKDLFGAPKISCFTCDNGAVFDAATGECVAESSGTGGGFSQRPHFYCPPNTVAETDSYGGVGLNSIQRCIDENKLLLDQHTNYDYPEDHANPHFHCIGQPTGTGKTELFQCPIMSLLNYPATDPNQGGGSGQEGERINVCDGIGANPSEIWVYNPVTQTCVPSGGARLPNGVSVVSQCNNFGPPNISCFTCDDDAVFDSATGECVTEAYSGNHSWGRVDYGCFDGDEYHGSYEETGHCIIPNERTLIARGFTDYRPQDVDPGFVCKDQNGFGNTCPFMNTDYYNGGPSNSGEIEEQRVSVCEGIGANASEIWIYDSNTQTCVPSGGASFPSGVSAVSQCGTSSPPSGDGSCCPLVYGDGWYWDHGRSGCLPDPEDWFSGNPPPAMECD